MAQRQRTAIFFVILANSCKLAAVFFARPLSAYENLKSGLRDRVGYGVAPRLLQRRFLPAPEGRQRVDRLDIGGSNGIDVDLITADAGRHRHIHAVGGAERAEQEIAALPEAAAGVAPHFGDAADIGYCVGIQLALLAPK